MEEKVSAPRPVGAATFESGARHMEEKLRAGGIEPYLAGTADPLHSAFAAKAAVHSGIGGMPLAGKAAGRRLSELWDMPRTGKGLAYVHVPFCETRCLYCMFYQNPLREEEAHAFTGRLERELAMWSDRNAQSSGLIHAVYFGGGTPTALAPEDIKRAVTAVRRYLPLANDCEITLEGRIHNFGEEKIEAALEAGVNRFSLGVQSFNTLVRQSVMRVDGRDAVIRHLERLASYDNAAVVIDLIYGFPYQTMEVWEDDLVTASAVPLDGVDCYQLNVFERSPLARRIASGHLPAAADTAMKADMFARSVEILTRDCWHRISNNHWRRTSRERNIYNELGKSACDCLAFGCGAGGRLHGSSYMMERRLSAWSEGVDCGYKPVMALQEPAPDWELLRTVSSQMELGHINIGLIGRRFGMPGLGGLVSEVTDQWVSAGLLRKSGDWLVQTVAGQFWHVTMAQLLIELLSRHMACFHSGVSPFSKAVSACRPATPGISALPVGAGPGPGRPHAPD